MAVSKQQVTLYLQASPQWMTIKNSMLMWTYIVLVKGMKMTGQSLSIEAVTYS